MQESCFCQWFRYSFPAFWVSDCKRWVQPGGFGKVRTHVLAHVTRIEQLQVTETLRVEQHQYRHHLAVRQAAGTVAMPLAGTSSWCFFNSGAKNLQNSSRMQKISIKFAVVIGVIGFCMFLISNCKDTKNLSLLQLFQHFSYVELTLIIVFRDTQ